MSQIFNVPQMAVNGFSATFSVKTQQTKLKARRKCVYIIQQSSLDEVKGDITTAIEPYWLSLMDILIKNPYGDRTFTQGNLCARTSGEDGVMYAVVYEQAERTND